ncbi:MAG: PolC-type DNA polymerase III [Bacilli bacterium]|nr:PolC-type DNA polymerase III [Bacilli bacterium]
MEERMQRFLASLNIDNVDDFDLEFEMIGKDRFNPKRWNMVINKKTPWSYKLLSQFQEGLNLINYEYLLRFTYKNRPNNEDLLEILNDWHLSIYHIPHDFNISFVDEGIVEITYSSEEEKSKHLFIVRDFKDFLNFINYDFVVTETIKEDEKPVEISKKKMQKIVEDATESANEHIANSPNEPVINDRNDVLKHIEEEHQKEIDMVGDEILKIMRQTAIEREKEKERQRLNKRGNYKIVDFIDAITADDNGVDFVGKVFSCEINEYGGVKRLKIGVGDEAGGAIFVSMKQNASLSDLTIANLPKSNVRVRGVAYVDEFNKSIMIRGHYIDLMEPDHVEPDDSEIKRVELHLHSNMSTQDGVTNMHDYCQYAKALGHTALAITDHGGIQAYPEAQKEAKKSGLKMIYGCEFYMVDDQLKFITNPCKTPLNRAKYVVLDLETTGLSARYDRIIEFGAVMVENGVVTSRKDILINPETELSKKIIDITNISNEMLKDKPTLKEVFPEILSFIKDAILVTHNAEFDFSFLQEASVNLGYGKLTNPVIDTLALSQYLFPNSHRHNLGSLCRNLDVIYDEESAHRADYDAEVLNNVWQPMLVLLTKDNLKLTHEELSKLETPKALLRHIRPVHVVALIKNKDGLKDMNKLVSLANVDYLADLPKIPRREIQKYRKNLLIGSACFNGEVFRTAEYYNKEKLKEIIEFYDYIEVQPPQNYSFLVDIGDLNQEDIYKYINDIIEASDEVGKKVVATGDVHYLTPREKIFRDVYISAKAVGGLSHPLYPFKRASMKHFENPDQHYRSTKEMLECFSFINKEKAYEIVVKNTNDIADSIESLLPVPNDHLYTPYIENVDQKLRDLCFNTAKELYGDPLPEFIEKRLNTELNGIISNGYAVVYYIAHKIVKKTHDDGFIVGSRGSVGSSFAATMAGITEVNALPPHYRCPKCKHFEFSNEEFPDIKSGYDLPTKKCPICGEEMLHDGQNIPFETFLGFNAEKTPDIDLNFPGDYQSRAHDYTKVLLGENNVFRAGTIETVAQKTAFGFARGYIERLYMEEGLNEEAAKEKALLYPRAKLEYIASGCVNVKRTTGQHPGGIVVVPGDHEITDFTPIQFPADEPGSAWRTTHFDYDAIHDTILKLDMLGHVDPMALKMMCDLTHVNINDIPLNDPEVLELFSSSRPLKLERNYLGQKTGALAIPEFGTDFVRGILETTLPKTFNDLVIISGLSHGTNVWNGNADTLINNGVATLQEVIGCRDDIMTYLISKGISSDIAFSIMEDVRHGKKLKEEYVAIMKANNVKQYYIDSCNLIKYLFPKGHAVAYVTMGVRVGYFKIHYPLEFYATFFSVRSKQYDIKAMIGGEAAIIERLEELKVKGKTRGEKMSPKEEEQLKTLQIAIEMVQRGYKFSNIDLYKSDATQFVVDKENKCLIPPFITLDGLGENNAVTVIEARQNGEFTSKEDLLRRTKLTTTNVKDLSEMGVLDSLSENDQLSLFDL